MPSAADPLLLKLASEEIRQIAGGVAEPENYYRGVEEPQEGLPGKILCFARHHSGELTGPQINPAQHHRCVLIAALSGTGQVCIDAESFPLREGQALLIHPFQFHSYAEIRPEAICWVFVTFEIPDAAGIAPLRSRPPSPLGAVELVLLREILQCWLDEPRHGLLSPHLNLLLRRLCSIAPARSPARRNARGETGLMERVNRHILPRIGEPMPLKQLAAALGESESHLRAKFRAATGGSLGRHLRQLRLQKACELLRTTELNVSEIAERCGFESVYTFSRTFKNGCGVSPRIYRESLDSI